MQKSVFGVIPRANSGVQIHVLQYVKIVVPVRQKFPEIICFYDFKRKFKCTYIK